MAHNIPRWKEKNVKKKTKKQKQKSKNNQGKNMHNIHYGDFKNRVQDGVKGMEGKVKHV